MDSTFEFLSLGLATALTPANIFWVFLGGLLGTIIGMLPGIGPPTGVAILIPLTYSMDPTSALITMCAIYYGAMYGGSRASIMINTPGDASAIVACFDGYPMTKNGEAGKALAISAIASFIGGVIGLLCLIFLTAPVASAALKFGPIETFALMFFALVGTITLSEGSLFKGAIAICIGFMLATVGLDPLTGILRFTFGVYHLQEGVDFLVLIIGVYAVTEVYKNYRSIHTKYAVDFKSIGKVWVPWKDFKKTIMPILRSSPLGFFVGVIPGMGASIATFMSYAMEKSFNKDPKKFGEGNIIGLAAPEAANNAASSGSIVPLLTLGIPGSGTTAVMLGALMLLGIKPGPLLFTQHPEIAWGVIASMIVGNIMLVFINLPLAIPLVQILKTPQRLLLPIILAMGYMGTYFLNYSAFDFILVACFGVVGYLFHKLEIPLPPMVLALILGGMTEQAFRNSMSLSGGSVAIFIQKPISAVLIALALVFLVYSIRKERKKAA